MLAPRKDDPNYKEEARRKRQNPEAFGAPITGTRPKDYSPGTPLKGTPVEESPVEEEETPEEKAKREAGESHLLKVNEAVEFHKVAQEETARLKKEMEMAETDELKKEAAEALDKALDDEIAAKNDLLAIEKETEEGKAKGIWGRVFG